MRRTRRTRVQVCAVSAVLLAITTALGGSDRVGRTDVGGSAHGHHLHASAELPLRLPSLLPQAGSKVSGGRIVTHFEGARAAGRVRGKGGGRMIYTGTGAWEPTLGIDEQGNIYYQGTPASRDVNVVVSRDGGGSWDEVTPSTQLYTLDPFLHVDTRTGRAFIANLTELGCVTVSHSDDVGQSWNTSKACGLTDHQNLFTGPPVTSDTGDYLNVVYMCAMDLGASVAAFATSCLKSLDGGITWLRTGRPAYTADPQHRQGNMGVAGWCDGGTGHGFADSKGIVYLPRGWCGQPYLAISRDEGATWERIQVAANGTPPEISTLCAGVCEDVTIFDHEAAVAVDRKGDIYYFWVAGDLLPYLAVSTDDGRSFSDPMMVGPPGLKEAWGPKIDVGANGRIALAYVGSTNAPGGSAPGAGKDYSDAVTWNGYITTSVDASSGHPRFFTASVNAPSDPIVRGQCRVGCGAMLDFIDVVIGPDGRPWTSMVDDCPPPPADACDDRAGFVGTMVGGPDLR